MTGARRNPSANRLVLPQEMECRSRALELSLLAGNIAGNVMDTAAVYVQRAEVFAKFIGDGNIALKESGTSPVAP